MTTYYDENSAPDVGDELTEAAEQPTAEAAVPQLPAEPTLPAPADFEVGAWFQGLRSTVRSVNIYQRSDLIGEIEELEQKLLIERQVAQVSELSLHESDELSDIEDELNDLRKEFVDSGVTFQIEGRSESWMNRVEKEWKNHSDTHGMSKDEKNVFVRMHQLAESIVEPKGVTYEHLAALREASEPQMRKMLVAFTMACNKIPQVTVPTSPQSSESRGRRRR